VGLPTRNCLLRWATSNEELVRAGVMLAGEGQQPSSKGARVRFNRPSSPRQADSSIGTTTGVFASDNRFRSSNRYANVFLRPSFHKTFGGSDVNGASLIQAWAA
jgi:hypothetical protein